MLTFVCISKW